MPSPFKMCRFTVNSSGKNRIKAWPDFSIDAINPCCRQNCNSRKAVSVKDRLMKVWIAKQIKNNKVAGWSVPLIISGLPVVTVSGEQSFPDGYT